MKTSGVIARRVRAIHNLDWFNFNRLGSLSVAACRRACSEEFLSLLWTLLCHCEESSFRIYHSPVSDGGGLTTGA